MCVCVCCRYFLKSGMAMVNDDEGVTISTLLPGSCFGYDMRAGGVGGHTAVPIAVFTSATASTSTSVSDLCT